VCKAPTAAGQTFVDQIFFTGQSETTNKATDTWAIKKIGAWPANDRPNSCC